MTPRRDDTMQARALSEATMQAAELCEAVAPAGASPGQAAAEAAFDAEGPSEVIERDEA